MAIDLTMAPKKLREHIEASLSVQASFDGMPLRTDAEQEVLAEAVRVWDQRNALILERAFTKGSFLESSPHSVYASAVGLRVPFPTLAAADVSAADLLIDARTKADRLRRLLANLDLYDLDLPQDAPMRTNGDVNQAPSVFIVHGHQEALVSAVNLLVRKTSDVEVTVLDDQANRGMTVIEKLETHLGDRSSFAVVIMTGDDMGRSNQESVDRPRARQNAVFELGYAVAALGRGNVAVLYEPGVEIPSDFAGVGYVEYDSAGLWKMKLLLELRSAGLPVDLNRL